MAPRIVETVVRPPVKTKPCKTTEEMTEICCVPTDELLCCETVVPWDGFDTEETKKALNITTDEKGRDSQGRYVEIRYKARSQPCGEKVTKFDTSQGNCCDQVTELLYDDENSVDVLADNSYGFVAWEGGKAPYIISIVGQGFGIGESKLKFLTTSETVVQIFTDDACGRCSVTITDSCNQGARGGIMATNGAWVEAYSSNAGIEGDGDGTEPYSEGVPFITDLGDRDVGTGYVLTAEQGGIRIEQTMDLFSTYGGSFAIRVDMASSIAYCQGSEIAFKNALTDAEHRLKGFCFTGDTSLLTCGTLVADDKQSTFYAVLGQQSTHWYEKQYGKLKVWSRQYLVNVSRTQVYEWRC